MPLSPQYQYQIGSLKNMNYYYYSTIQYFKTSTTRKNTQLSLISSFSIPFGIYFLQVYLLHYRRMRQCDNFRHNSQDLHIHQLSFIYLIILSIIKTHDFSYCFGIRNFSCNYLNDLNGIIIFVIIPLLMEDGGHT